jgi:hypothetical protein
MLWEVFMVHFALPYERCSLLPLFPCKQENKKEKLKSQHMTHEFKLINVQLPYELPCKFHANPHLIIIPCQFTPISLTSKFNPNSKGTIKWISYFN